MSARDQTPAIELANLTGLPEEVHERPGALEAEVYARGIAHIGRAPALDNIAKKFSSQYQATHLICGLFSPPIVPRSTMERRFGAGARSGETMPQPPGVSPCPGSSPGGSEMRSLVHPTP